MDAFLKLLCGLEEVVSGDGGDSNKLHIVVDCGANFCIECLAEGRKGVISAGMGVPSLVISRVLSGLLGGARLVVVGRLVALLGRHSGLSLFGYCWRCWRSILANCASGRRWGRSSRQHNLQERQSLQFCNFGGECCQLFHKSLVIVVGGRWGG